MFEAPIPGQSLTVAPRSMPYERPPEIVDPKEALKMHMERLNDPKMIEDLLDLVEIGSPDLTIRDITEGILRSAVAEGIHSVDVSLIIAPVIHEFIKSTADQAGLEYDEGLEEDDTEKKQSVKAARLKKMMQKGAIVGSEKTAVEPPQGATAAPEPEGGLMRRPVRKEKQL